MTLQASSWLRTMAALMSVLVLTFVVDVSTQQPAIEIYEGKTCQGHIDCLRETTGLICVNSNTAATSFHCKCQFFLVNPPQAVIPYYNKDVGRCVIKAGQMCAHDVNGHPFPTMKEVECEPNSYCLRDRNVNNPRLYGRCVKGADPNGVPRATFGSLSWISAFVLMILSYTQT